MKAPLDDKRLIAEFPLHPLLRVLCYLEEREYTLEFGVVAEANRWYGPARKMVHSLYFEQVTA